MYRQTVERPPFRWWQTLLLTAGIIVFEVAFYLVLRLCEVPHPTIWSGLLLLAVFVITFVIALFYDVSYCYTADADTLKLEKRLGKLTLRSFSCPIRDLTLDAPGAGTRFAYSRKKGRTVISKAGRAVFAPDETMLSCLTDPASAYIDLHKDELLSELSALIAIPSVKGDPSEGCPFGKDCARALDYTLSLCEKFGMKTKNVDGYCGWAEAGQGDKLIGILCHLDVVPVGDGWDSDPFTADIRDGFVFGRGAIDDKGPAVAAIYALAAAKEAGELKARVRLIFGCDEESGWGCMDRYTASEELPDMAFTPDAEYPLIIAEKGIAHLTLNTGLTEGDYQLYLRGGLRPNMVPDKVHATLIGPMDRLFAKLNAYDVHQDKLSFDQSGDRLEIDAVGVGAHGSMPDKGVNAFFALFRFLEYLDLGASQGEFVKAVNRLLTDKTDGSGLDLALSDEASGALTVNLGMGFIGKNDVFPDMTDDACRLVLDIRYPVSYSLADVTARVDAVLPATWECTVGHGQAPLQMPEDSALVKTLMSVWHDHTGRDDKPIAIGGGTYARALPGKAVAFGVQFPGAPDKAHQPNESVRVDDLLLSAKMFADAILRLSADE